MSALVVNFCCPECQITQKAVNFRPSGDCHLAKSNTHNICCCVLISVVEISAPIWWVKVPGLPKTSSDLYTLIRDGYNNFEMQCVILMCDETLLLWWYSFSLCSWFKYSYICGATINMIKKTYYPRWRSIMRKDARSLQKKFLNIHEKLISNLLRKRFFLRTIWICERRNIL